MKQSIFRAFMTAHGDRHPVRHWPEGSGTRWCNGVAHAFEPDDMPRLLRDWHPCICPQTDGKEPTP